MERQAGRILPTKKQQELLAYIGRFITEHGYSPSYREIMNGLGYTSVATVSLHVQSLIMRGHLRKRDHSARSLEVVGGTDAEMPALEHISPAEEKWLVDRIARILTQAERSSTAAPPEVCHGIAVLVEALHILGIEAPVQGFTDRLTALQGK